jgi:hypothetical protein
MPMKKVAVVQSNYIPWKGYFDLVNSVDEFILYDDMHCEERPLCAAAQLARRQAARPRWRPPERHRARNAAGLRD